MCRRAPKLLHANCPDTLKTALMQLDLSDRSPAALMRNLRTLDDAWRTPELAQQCATVQERLPGADVLATVCNANFLLQRYAAMVRV
eukprot:CAMPEP_0181254920 /NCGR_PEP_ID=MMETSP1096-20121128/48866_1 /TAXON_ID=156174 ORGANISM="Chrysochromulina ericina, Strain CCMP281" /NCGR_SAMPLE_ID=MMETSP1096 /ASSEMBLY_ACC=CAM_ASM_000453 /LENGTH=86 /DNA_ID=CAMNT_0023352999 /DNA_START=102 /DNA_END=362 /DNA_ORIENTATION=+